MSNLDRGFGDCGPLTEEDIAAYLDGFEDAIDKTKRHIQHCTYCREFIRILEGTPRPEQMEQLKTWHCTECEPRK